MANVYSRQQFLDLFSLDLALPADTNELDGAFVASARPPLAFSALTEAERAMFASAIVNSEPQKPRPFPTRPPKPAHVRKELRKERPPKDGDWDMPADRAPGSFAGGTFTQATTATHSEYVQNMHDRPKYVDAAKGATKTDKDGGFIKEDLAHPSKDIMFTQKAVVQQELARKDPVDAAKDTVFVKDPVVATKKSEFMHKDPVDAAKDTVFVKDPVVATKKSEFMHNDPVYVPKAKDPVFRQKDPVHTPKDPVFIPKTPALTAYTQKDPVHVPRDIGSNFNERTLNPNDTMNNSKETRTPLNLGQIFKQPNLPAEILQAPPPYKFNPPQWIYQDITGVIQGPFETDQMHRWYLDGYFSEALLVRRIEDLNFISILRLTQMFGVQSPFIDMAREMSRRGYEIYMKNIEDMSRINGYGSSNLGDTNNAFSGIFKRPVSNVLKGSDVNGMQNMFMNQQVHHQQYPHAQQQQHLPNDRNAGEQQPQQVVNTSLQLGFQQQQQYVDDLETLQSIEPPVVEMENFSVNVPSEQPTVNIEPQVTKKVAKKKAKQAALFMADIDRDISVPSIPDVEMNLPEQPAAVAPWAHAQQKPRISLSEIQAVEKKQMVEAQQRKQNAANIQLKNEASALMLQEIEKQTPKIPAHATWASKGGSVAVKKTLSQIMQDEETNQRRSVESKTEIAGPVGMKRYAEAIGPVKSSSVAATKAPVQVAKGPVYKPAAANALPIAAIISNGGGEPGWNVVNKSSRTSTSQASPPRSQHASPSTAAPQSASQTFISWCRTTLQVIQREHSSFSGIVWANGSR